MNWKSLLLCGGLAVALFGCFSEDPALGGPTAEDLENARRVGELPLDAVLESVTFINTANGQQITVDVPAPAMRFNNCNATWCPVADAENPTANYYCPGQDPPTGDGETNLGLQFTYDSPTDKVSFLGFEGSPSFEAWAERELFFSIAVDGQQITLSCSDCPGKYEDFLYTDRQVNLRSRD